VSAFSNLMSAKVTSSSFQGIELMTYNFNGSSDEIASDRNSFILAKSRNPSNGLTLNTGIPLRFEDIDVISCCEIESGRS